MSDHQATPITIGLGFNAIATGNNVITLGAGCSGISAEHYQSGQQIVIENGMFGRNTNGGNIIISSYSIPGISEFPDRYTLSFYGVQTSIMKRSLDSSNADKLMDMVYANNIMYQRLKKLEEQNEKLTAHVKSLMIAGGHLSFDHDGQFP